MENDAIEASISHLNREIEGDKNEIIRILNQRASTKGKIQRYDTMMEQNADPPGGSEPAALKTSK